MEAEVVRRLIAPDVSVTVDKFGRHPFLLGKVTGIATGISLVEERLEVAAAVAAEADYRYHDMLAEAVDGGNRKNRINGVYAVPLPNGARGVSRVTRRSTNPLVADGICNDRDITDKRDRAVLLAATAALSLVMLNPEKYVEQRCAVIEANAVESVLNGKSPAKLLSSMPGVLW